MFIDTHAHLYWDSFKEDFDEVIKKCLEAKVEKLINIGVDVKTSEKALKLAEGSLEGCSLGDIEGFSSIGIHPHEAIKYLDNPDVSIREDINKLEEIHSKNPEKVILVGECGLDYLIEPEFIPADYSPEDIKTLQKKLLKAQIDLAKKLSLPLSIHVRDDRSKNPENSECWEEILEMTKDHFGIFHCYSGLEGTTSKIPSTNFLVSFAATITYPKNEYLREAAKSLPLEKMVLETDCPFLPPQSHRGQRNDPATVKEIAQVIAELKNLNIKDVEEQTTKNVVNLTKI